MMRWQKSEDVKTEGGEIGHWDGERTELFICKDSDGEHFIGRAYHGTIDGSEFIDWYDKEDNELSDIVSYHDIPR